MPESKPESKIVNRDHAILRKKALPVSIEEIRSAKIKKNINDMKKALDAEADGVALAAPQINLPIRIFIVSGKVLGKAIYRRSDGKIQNLPEKAESHMVCVNPRLIKISKEKKVMEEGCLSVRYAYGKIKRPTKVTMEAYDENGKKFTRGASGLLAQIFQHEIDHLNGILFTDNAQEIKELTREEWVSSTKE